MEIIDLSFECIKKIWSSDLWQNRVGEIKKVSSIDYNLKINMNIYDSAPYYYGMLYDSKIVGVNSVYETNDSTVRSRGLWISNSFRGNGFSQVLLDNATSWAVEKNAVLLWSLPRAASFFAYEKNGFKRKELIKSHKMEFGPNYYAQKDLGDFYKVARK